MLREPLRSASPSPLEVLPWDDPAAERRRLRRAAGAALLVHAALFLVVWPGGPLRSPAEVLEAPRFVVHTLHLRPPEPAAPEVGTPEPPVEAPTVVVPAPPLEPPEPAVRPSEIVRPPELPAALLDAGWEIPALGPPPLPGPQPFDAREMEAPVRLETPLPAYTEPARRARREGDVVLEAVIDSEGRVRDARVLQSLGFGLDEAALLALADWRFEPARKAGRAIPVIYKLVVRFRLSG